MTDLDKVMQQNTDLLNENTEIKDSLDRKLHFIRTLEQTIKNKNDKLEEYEQIISHQRDDINNLRTKANEKVEVETCRNIKDAMKIALLKDIVAGVCGNPEMKSADDVVSRAINISSELLGQLGIDDNNFSDLVKKLIEREEHSRHSALLSLFGPIF